MEVFADYAKNTKLLTTWHQDVPFWQRTNSS